MSIQDDDKQGNLLARVERLLEQASQAIRSARDPARAAVTTSVTGGHRTLRQQMAIASLPPDKSQLLEIAQRIIVKRSMRSRYIDADLFGEPAFDILLDLFVASILGTEVSVGSACAAANVPPSTALRYIAALTERGLLMRATDPDDGRRIHVMLSASGEQQMSAYIAACGAA